MRKQTDAKRRINLFEYYHGYWKKVTGLTVMAGISAQFQAVSLVIVVLIGKAIAGNHRHRYKGTIGPFQLNMPLTKLTLVAMGCIVVAAALDTTTNWISSKMSTDYDRDLRDRVMGEYLDADYATQSAEQLGTLSVLMGYVTRSAGMLIAIVSGLITGITLVIYVGVALLIDYRAAILMVVSVTFLSLVLRPVMRKIKEYSRALSQQLVVYTRQITEATRMVRDLRVFDSLGPLSEQIEDRNHKMLKIRLHASFVNGMVSPIWQYLGMLIVLTTLYVAEHSSSIDIVKLGAIALLLVRSLGYGQGIQAAYQNIVSGIPFIEKLEAMRATYREHRTVDGTVALGDVESLELDQVRYSYDGVVDAVAGVSATFHVGEIIGIVGPSGGGKSTLSQLLLRLRDPYSGQIRVNGVPSSDYTLSSWYRRISLVPQDPHLFNNTVAENIALLDKSMTREQIMDAAKAAGVHDVIRSLDNGYETRLGPAHRDLSGGQIQRIGIARALSRGAQILVLDEPTSALDVHSESIIQSTLESLRGRSLVIIIAHRLSTLSICDRILVLREGEVETIGTISEVTESSEFFRRALEAGTLDVRMPEPAPQELVSNVATADEL